MNALLFVIIHPSSSRLQEFIRHNGFNEHRVYVVVLVKNLFQRRLEEIPSARVDDNMGYIQTIPQISK
jgi:argonaute-like protein implicated in RNA metabolism and viral defense